MNREEINNKLEFMQELANRFPTKDDAVTEIINLNAILALPRGPEHFMSDLHGQADAFNHILNNASGGIRFRIGQLFDNVLTKEEEDELYLKQIKEIIWAIKEARVIINGTNYDIQVNFKKLKRI